MPLIEYHITFQTEIGVVNVTGPIQDKVLTFGVLRLVDQIVVDFKPESQIKRAVDTLTLPNHSFTTESRTKC